jgi:hypothetical protein
MLSNLEPRTLLFLNNIKEIRWNNLDSKNFMSKSSKKFPGIQGAKRVKIISASAKEEYVIFHKPIYIEGAGLKVEVAYKLGKSGGNKNTIMPLEQTSKLVAYFPTEKETSLNFIIQGPYKTTPNRENIPIEEEKNKIMIEATADLVAESISKTRKMGMLNVDFLKALPLDEKNTGNYIYKRLFEKVKDKLLSEKLIPTDDNKYGTPAEVAIPKNYDLVEILNNNDLWALFSKKKWINKETLHDSDGLIRKYFVSDLGILEIGNEELIEVLDEQFLSKKSDGWLRRFYGYMAKYPNLWKEDEKRTKSPLRYKPIIRLETGEMWPPFDRNGTIQVYLPGNGASLYRTVKRTFMDHKGAVKFLKELGLTEPDIFSEIEKYIFPKYEGGYPEPDQDYLNDFLKLMNGYEKLLQSKKISFAKRLSESSFILSASSDNSEKSLRKPNDVYFLTEELKTYFCGHSPAFFVSEDLIGKLDRNKVEAFLEEIGVSRYPRRIRVEGIAKLTNEEKIGRVGYTNRPVNRIDYEYDGLDNLLAMLNEDKSIILWKFLLKRLENCSNNEAKEFFKGEENWEYYWHNRSGIDAAFTIKLRNASWVLGRDGQFRRPSDFTFDQVSDSYIKEGENLDILKQVLNFKPDYILSLPQEDRVRLDYARKIPMDKLRSMAEAEYRESEEETSQTSEVDEDTIPVKFLEYIPHSRERRTSYYTLTGVEKAADQGYKEKMKEDEKFSPVDRKKVGYSGEKSVYKYLKEKYQKDSFKIQETKEGFNASDDHGGIYEIVWANKHGNGGIGYDFLIKKDVKITEYIEVKTKTNKNLESVEMTAAQWALARELFNKNLGEKYSLYVVSNTESGEREIRKLRNPFKLWKEGIIEAHPINLIL